MSTTRGRDTSFNKPLALAGSLALVAGVMVLVLRPDPLADVSAWLTAEGLRANPGLVATPLPGTVITIDDDVPTVVADAETCFPKLAPRREGLPLPVKIGRRQDALVLEAEQARIFLPDLPSAADWRLEVPNPRRTWARPTILADLLIADCVGDVAETFVVEEAFVVIEAVIASEFTVVVPRSALSAWVDYVGRLGPEVETREDVGEVHHRIDRPIVLAFGVVPLTELDTQ
ncbi:MAG: hypothetical protein AAGD38_13830 [Acidobacteriota bacterium]